MGESECFPVERREIKKQQFNDDVEWPGIIGTHKAGIFPTPPRSVSSFVRPQISVAVSLILFKNRKNFTQEFGLLIASFIYLLLFCEN